LRSAALQSFYGIQNSTIVKSWSKFMLCGQLISQSWAQWVSADRDSL